MNKKELVIRARGILVFEDKLFVVKHEGGSSYYALPGGHLEYGEDPLKCTEREIFEELGIAPKIGRLLYVNTFTEENKQTIEFLFEIENAEDFYKIEKLSGTHTHELSEMSWIGKDAEIDFLPKDVWSDFKEGNMGKGETRFIS